MRAGRWQRPDMRREADGSSCPIALRYPWSVSGETQATAPEEGPLAALLERIPASWRERLTEIFDLDPAQIDWLGGESSRIGGNLLLLLERGWPEMVTVGGRLALFGLGGMLLVGVATAVLGWVLYLVLAGPLLRRGWRTGRLVGCFVATAVLLCAGGGGAWAGLWLGIGRATEEAIEQRYVVERMAAATFLAATLGQDELPEDLDPDAVEGLLDRAQRRSADSWTSFRARAEAVAEAGMWEPVWLRPELLVGVVERLGGEGAPDLAALHGVLSTPVAANGGDALPQTAGIRRRAVNLLRGAVYAQVATGLGFGLGLPLAGLVLFGLVGSLVHRGSHSRVSAP